MFVHIGNNIILEEKDIIGIYNIESMKDSEEYKNLIESLKEQIILFHKQMEMQDH